MANQFTLTPNQVTELRALRDAGSYAQAYNKMSEWIGSSPNVDDQTKLFFRLAGEVNADLNTSANRYIRTITRLGLELSPGADSSNEAIQATSNQIAIAIFTQIINGGGVLPQLATIIRNDVTTAITNGKLTWGGWGGAVFFLSERVGPKEIFPQ